MTFAEFIRQARHKKGLSQSKCAAVAGISLRALEEIEHGQTHNHRLSTISALWHALDLDGDAVLAFGLETKNPALARRAVRGVSSTPKRA